MRFLLFLFITLLLPASAAAAGPASPPTASSFSISPKQPLMDEVIHIRLSGLPARQAVTITAKMQLGGYLWQSSATFLADQRGNVDLNRQAPSAGTYSGLDPMGLFWSMEPVSTQATTKENREPEALDPVPVSFTAEADGRSLASASIVRRWLRPSVKVTDIRENGLIGRLFEPETKRQLPGILVLSGSEGGLKNWNAALLASRGYTTFALAYFRLEGLPDELVDIPLEYLKNGLDWMRKRDSIDSSRIGVMGSSKGGELSLLLASMYPEIKVVVAYNSGTLVGTGIDRAHSGAVSSWTYRGKPLPFARCKATPEFTSQFKGNAPLRLLPMNGPCLRDEEAIKGAVIPVEKIRGAVLLVTGGDDQTGPAAESAEMIIRKLRRQRHRYAYRHLSYPAAGHAIYSFYAPTTRSTTAGRLALGGSPQANAWAHADSWPKVLRFLRETLRQWY